jgi:4-alpha-glucanotransferase
MPSSPTETALRRLARAAGVADTYEASGRWHRAPDATLRAVLAELGHPADDEATAAASLRSLRRRAWTRAVDPVAVVWREPAAGPTRVGISAREGTGPQLALTLEDGMIAPLANPIWGGTADVDGAPRRRGSVALPDDLPLGYHRLEVDDGTTSGACTVIVAPEHAPSLDDQRSWGWMLQAYAVRSSASWGQGEFTDVAALAEWSAGRGADFVLINPVHAAAPVVPQHPSPYSPTSRRFANPSYLHVPDVPGFAALDADERARLSGLGPQLAPDSAMIDRDATWRAKRAALRRSYEVRDDAEQAALDGFRTDRGPALQRFATFCALAEEHGVPFARWPDGLRDPRTGDVDAWARAHEDDVGFHAWLQLQCARQLTDAQRRATTAGMRLGVIHDLAVGVDPGGADVWSLPDEFARTMSIGAPPDAFNQLGQNWGMPPPLPEAARERAYATERDLLAAALTTGGGLRIDHILGLSRLFWIPRDAAGPADGTYVRYPAEERFAVLVLEAHRADAVVIGEDLGTVDPRIRALMRRRGVAGSAVLWFELVDGARRPAARYPRNALASVTTHDLPTATGWWDGSTVDRRDRLGLLDGTRAEADAALADDHASMLALLRGHGCLRGPDDDVRERVLALHRFLASTPSALVAAALWDAVGDPRPPNVPGTVDEHPNWRLPLAVPTPDGPRPVLLEELRDDDAVDELIDAVTR